MEGSGSYGDSQVGVSLEVLVGRRIDVGIIPAVILSACN